MESVPKKRGRPPRKATKGIELPPFSPGPDIDSQVQFLSNAALQVAYAQLQDGTIAPSTLNKLIDLGLPENELKRQSLEAKTTLDTTKVDSIKADTEEKVGHLQVIDILKGYRGNTFDERSIDNFG